MKKILVAIMAVFVLVSCQQGAPTVSPRTATMCVGDTLQLVVTGKTNPQWETDFTRGMAEKEIVAIIENNQVVALASGRTYVGFQYFVEHSLVLDTKSAGCEITIEEPTIEVD